MLQSPIYGSCILKHRPHLSTYPRSGSHYFDRIFQKESGFRIEKTHTVNWFFDKDCVKYRTVITIARDPRESIASYIAAEHRDVYPVTTNRINQVVSEYILLYSFLYEHADYVIDFKDLVKNPDATVKKLISLLDIKEDEHYLFDGDYGKEDPFFLESSKDLPDYNKYLLDDFNIDLCYFYYNRLLEKKIII
jgi:hypothetical protein